jgi:hypothetical protein
VFRFLRPVLHLDLQNLSTILSGNRESRMPGLEDRAISPMMRGDAVNTVIDRVAVMLVLVRRIDRDENDEYHREEFHL